MSTSSDAHQPFDLDLDDLQAERAYGDKSLAKWMRYGGPGFKVYGRSKLANILFTRELARTLAGTGVTANCFHPGFVATRFGEQTGGIISFGIGIAKRFALTPQQGAETLVYLASSPDVANVTGQYFYKGKVETPNRAAQDDATAARLWAETRAWRGSTGRFAQRAPSSEMCRTVRSVGALVKMVATPHE